VSRALRGLPDVAPDTRERVVRAARDLDYVASPYAARLASGRTGSVGVVVPFVTRWFFTQVVAGAERVLRDAGYDLLLYNLGGPAGRDRFFGRMPVRKRVDGLLVLCTPMAEAEIAAVRALRLPVVVVGAVQAGFASVRVDDAASARLAVNHLIELGHRRIGLISGGSDEAMYASATIDRRRGYWRALRDAGIRLDPDLDVPGHFTPEGGRAAMEWLLGLPEPPTAVFAASDEMAYGAMRAIRAAGLTVGRDISVVGFDDHEMSDLLELTTVAQPAVRQGELAARALLAALGPKAPAPRAQTVPTRLVVRGSTRRPAGGDRRLVSR
jgi:DNA-binding LacI/PurR family transcriptional regulator